MKKPSSKRPLKMILLLSAAHAFFILTTQLSKHYLMPKIEPYLPEILFRILSRMLIPYALIMPISYLLFLRALEPVRLKRKKSLRGSSFFKLFILQSALSSLFFLLLMIGMAISDAFPAGQRMPETGGTEGFSFFLRLVFNPLAEEWIGRKLILERLRPLGERGAVLWSSFFFAVLHVFSQNLFAALLAFFTSLIWAWVTLKTGRLIYAVLLHALSNAFSFFLPQILTRTKAGSMVFLLLQILLIPAALIIFIRNKEKIRLQQPQS